MSTNVAQRSVKRIVILLSLVALSACSTPPSQNAVSQTLDSRSGAGADLCQISPPIRNGEWCQTAEIDGKSYRYGFMPAVSSPAEASGNTVIVDVGGPGVSPLSLTGLSNLRQNYGGARLDNYNVLVLEEPWVTGTTSAACESALRNYYKSARSQYNQAERLSTMEIDDCLDGSVSYGFTPSVYNRVVHAAEKANDTKITGFVGASFGAARLRYLDFEPADFSILINPFPVNSEGDAWLSARADQLRANVDLAVPGAAQYPTPVANRSLPMTEFDVDSAAVQAAYTGDRNTALEVKQIASESDALWGRYFTHDISAGWLAYWQEACPALIWTDKEGPQASTDGVARVLEAMHAPCRTLRSGEAVAAEKPAIASCIAASARDAVTPLGLIETTWSAQAIVRTESTSHRQLEGLNACWVEVSTQK